MRTSVDAMFGTSGVFTNEQLKKLGDMEFYDVRGW